MALLALSISANAENDRPKFENLRYEEGWSALRDAPESEHVLDPIKYIPFDEEEQFWLSLGG